MKWYELNRIINAVVCMIAYVPFALILWHMKNRMKIDLRKRRTQILSGIALFCVLFGALSFKTFIVEKYDFRGKWEAYQFRKTMIDADAFQKPIEPPAELGN